MAFFTALEIVSTNRGLAVKKPVRESKASTKETSEIQFFLSLQS